eukprot:7783035-Pyramimonas_sp.AAC.1
MDVCIVHEVAFAFTPYPRQPHAVTSGAAFTLSQQGPTTLLHFCERCGAWVAARPCSSHPETLRTFD